MKMIKIIILCIILVVSSFASTFDNWEKQASVKPILVQKGKSKHWCSICGMSIKHFYKTSYSIKIDNSKSKQYCSIRCLLVDKKYNSSNINTIKTVDSKTQKQIDASKAFYVVGSTITGTMTKISKLAFFNKKDAKSFKNKYSGEIKTFKEVLDIANKSLQKDILMINKKREKKIYPIGKKIYNKMCKKISLNKYKQINNLKADITNLNLCDKSIKGKKLQIVSLYLWDKVRIGKIKKNGEIIKITKDEKCPICGMYVYKYPRWVAQIFYTNPKHHFSFDGVKDLMKYYFKNKININKILVRDYYTQKAINAKKAFYVMYSDIYGPMGNELIPFALKSDAKIFKKDHKGKFIIDFKNITEEMIKKLD